MENLVVGMAFGSHNGGTYLAHAHTVPPSTAMNDETLRSLGTFGILVIDSEVRRFQVRVTERATYLQFLTDGERSLTAHNL